MTKFGSHEDSVQQWMSIPTNSVQREGTVRDVLELMKGKQITSVPVVDPQGLVIGIVTQRDLASVVLSTDQLLDSDYPHYEDCLWAVDLIQRRLGSDKVTEVMSESVASIEPGRSMWEAAKQMTELGIHHLAVTKNGKLLGMLSSSDFMRLVASMG
ncbi:inosine 5'-monophosphate dehydrogenase [Novipirellula galeiformis]|uniref:Inosine 5'-monophosphate dehydrogenase n=1 Tax=Novipirellula galeiformis TaxID=2528004 RepID=A0A5C6CFX6_9BACT|nr:CBS domain-containing protein [Novipirellula galeiformis]TWU22281.1 inosine 5'-monophosphate dehydrogenase [Novipirellula galeiformis]